MPFRCSQDLFKAASGFGKGLKRKVDPDPTATNVWWLEVQAWRWEDRSEVGRKKDMCSPNEGWEPLLLCSCMFSCSSYIFLLPCKLCVPTLSVSSPPFPVSLLIWKVLTLHVYPLSFKEQEGCVQMSLSWSSRNRHMMCFSRAICREMDLYRHCVSWADSFIYGSYDSLLSGTVKHLRFCPLVVQQVRLPQHCGCWQRPEPPERRDENLYYTQCCQRFCTPIPQAPVLTGLYWQNQVILARAVGSVTGENIWDYGTPVFHGG